MLKRKIYDQMLAWKQHSGGQTALLIDGARRVGKSYIAELFARQEYRSHILIDLVYNPKETAFMELGRTWGAKVYGGLQMFEEQAKKTWEIFQI